MLAQRPDNGQLVACLIETQPPATDGEAFGPGKKDLLNNTTKVSEWLMSQPQVWSPNLIPWLLDQASATRPSLVQRGVRNGQHPAQGPIVAPGSYRLPIVWKQQQVDFKLLLRP